MKYNSFVFERYDFDYSTGTLSLHYRYEDGPQFEEKIVFGPVSANTFDANRSALDQAFKLLLLVAGVSYFKAFLPPRLVCSAFELDEQSATFAQNVYVNGLAEFAFQNQISLEGKVNFAPTAIAPRAAKACNLPRMTLVPIGGGKDSIVTAECLKQAGEPLTLFALGNASPISKTIEMTGLPYVRVLRYLDPLLLKLNSEGALNGHVPITAILSIIATCSALLSGADAIAMSNEHSASFPNLEIDGRKINHQYSKSLEFEADLAGYISRYIAPNLTYFSFLRPMTEIEIARRFAQARRYFPIFRSCNASFKLNPAQRATNWCCNCPKCRFVFLALAPFVPKTELLSIFGRNLLADTEQIRGYSELCGLSSYKPFECVGQIEESVALMCHLATNSEWSSDVVVHSLSNQLVTAGSSTLHPIDPFLTFQAPHRLPEHYLSILHASA